MDFTIEITQQCNFRCNYCCFSGEYNQMRFHSDRYISQETIQKSIEFIKKSAHKKEHIVVSFYGGESLLGLNSILFIMNELYDFFGERISFDLSTNGYLLTPKTVDKLLKYDVGISVSLDGCKIIHDKNRRTINDLPTFDVVVSNLISFKRNHPEEYRKRIRLLITSGSLSDIKIMNEYYSDLKELIGEKPIFISRIYPNFNKGLIYDDNISDMIDFYESAIERKKRGISDLYTLLLDNLLKKTKKKFLCNENSNHINLKTCLDCQQRAFIDIDGNISPCEKFDSKHFIGSVRSGIDIKLLKKISYRYYFRRSFLCSECEIVEYCSRCLADLKMTFAEQKRMCDIYKKNVKIAILINKKLSSYASNN